MKISQLHFIMMNISQERATAKKLKSHMLPWNGRLPVFWIKEDFFTTSLVNSFGAESKEVK